VGITPISQNVQGVLVWNGLKHCTQKACKILEKIFFCPCKKYVIILVGGWGD